MGEENYTTIDGMGRESSRQFTQYYLLSKMSPPSILLNESDFMEHMGSQ